MSRFQAEQGSLACAGGAVCTHRLVASTAKSAGCRSEISVSDDGDVLTVEEAGKLLKIGRTALYAAVARNQIPHRRVGKQIRFSRAALMLWLSSWSLQGAKEGKK